MGTTTTVSRRMVKIKFKKTNKPHVPLPRRPSAPPSDDDEMVGEEAITFVMRAPAPRPAPERSGWQKALKPAGMAFGAIVCGVFAYAVLNASNRPSYERRTETAAASSLPTGASRGRTRGAGSAYPGASVAEPIVLSNRSTPTDESFRATSYVRKKVYLPNIDGECVVKGGLDRVVGECLRSQLGR